MRPVTDLASHATPADPARVLASWRRQLALEEARLEPVSLEEIEAYIDGTGDDADRACFEERLARTPALAAIVADLAAVRGGLESTPERPSAIGTPGRLLPFRRPEFRRRLGWAAVAAAALIAAVLVEPGSRGPQGSRAASATAPGSSPLPAAAPASDEPVFADGFEDGSAAGWSTVTPSG